MTKTLWIILLSCFSLTIIAQDESPPDFKTLYESQKYDEIISSYDSLSVEYSAKSLYYIGMAHYMKEEDSICIKLMDKSIKKDVTDPSPHYIKGNTLNYMGEYEMAINSFKNAIELNDTLGEFYSGIGDSYQYLKELDKSIKYFQIASRQNNPPDRSFVMIGHNYNALGNKEKALEAFYIAKEKISKESASYENVLYNIGLAELLSKNYIEAESAFNELIEITQSYYMAYAKLIQIYYAQKQYKKADPLKAILYDAYEKGLLSGSMKNMFCFDQFYWNGKLIQVWERFAEPKDEIYPKHIFFILNENGDIDYKIQTESTIIMNENDDLKYLLGMLNGDMHATFNVGFIENFKYDDLKESVINVLEGKITPVASSRPTRN